MSDDVHKDWVELLAMLADVYKPEGVGIWLVSRQRQFDGLTVSELASAGRFDEVLAAAERLVSGAFS